jgi:hypothetical protein
VDGASVRVRPLGGPRDLPVADRDRLCAWLEQSIATGWPQLERIGAPRASALHDHRRGARVPRRFRFRATAAEHEAMAKFRELDASARDAGKVSLARGKSK